MNQYPPYGDPSRWGSGSPPQLNPGGQFVPQDPYAGGQAPVYPPQQTYGVPYGQEGQPQPWQTAAGTWEQPATWQQQPREQQQAVPQQQWQPYSQGGQAWPQGYPQGYPPQEQNPYPVYNQQGQQLDPSQAWPSSRYSGYISRPAEKKQPVSLNLAVKALLYAVPPVLFVLGLVLGSPVLNWIFLAAAIAAIVLVWMMDVATPNERLTISLVYGAMAVVSLVMALNGPAEDNRSYPPAGVNSGYSWENTATPSPTPTATVTPGPSQAVSAAEEQVRSFFYYWAVDNDEGMLSVTLPSWRASVTDPKTELFYIRANRIPDPDFTITGITGTDSDTTRTATVRATIDKRNNRDKERYAFKVLLIKENGVWYVDPLSLKSYEKETPTQASVNLTPTQPPLYTGTPNTVLYYNANGGSMYHLDGNCRLVGDQYKPLATFYFSELGNAPYNALRPCNVCGAPIPD